MVTDKLIIRINREFSQILRLISDKKNLKINELVGIILEDYLENYDDHKKDIENIINQRILYKKKLLDRKIYKQNIRELKDTTRECMWFWNSFVLLVKVLSVHRYTNFNDVNKKINQIIDCQLQLLESYNQENIFEDEIILLNSFRDIKVLEKYIQSRGNPFIIDKKLKCIGISKDE